MAKVPKFLQPYLASYDLSQLDIQKDKRLIITEVLNKGDGEALEWLTENYKDGDIRNAVSNPIRGFWMKSVLSYWLKILGIKLHPKTLRQAILNLNP